MKKILLHPFALATIGGLLLCAGWPTLPFAPLLFIGFVPFLFIETMSISPFKKWMIYYWGLLVWNVGTTWWVCYASVAGGIAAIVLNALLMSVPFLFFELTKKKMGAVAGYFSLVIYWLAFEKIHLTWEFTWPWLTLGNGLAMFPKMIQWYSITGHLGGSLWIWVINILIFLLIKNWNTDRNRRLIYVITAFIIPILISIIIYGQSKNSLNKNVTIPVAIVQPNIDPYNEKFEDGSEMKQMNTFFSLADKVVDSTTSLLLLPETAVPDGIWLKEAKHDVYLQQFKKYLAKHPQLHLLCGATVVEEYNQAKTVTAKPFGKEGNYTDIFNSAFFCDSTMQLQYYYKSKLVPLVERVPYPGVFNFLTKFTIDLGGSSTSLGTQPERSVFKTVNYSVAPVICYESVFGSYVSEYVKNGANMICIITNDGWWENTDGHRQHLHYASLRAIETHRCIARCANTGTSCFINEQGEISDETDWWQEATIKKKIPIFFDETWFVKYGGVMEWAVTYFAALLLIIVAFKRKS